MSAFDAELLYAVIDAEFTVLCLKVREEGGAVKIDLRAILREQEDRGPFWFRTEYARGLLDRIEEQKVQRMILSDIRVAMRLA